MKLSSISLIVAALAAIAAIAKAVPVDFETHKEGETRHLEAAKECWKVSCLAEEWGRLDIVRDQARASAGQHTHMMGHKKAKEAEEANKANKANKANEGKDGYPLSTKSSAEMALRQSEKDKKELEEMPRHREAVKRHEHSIRRCIQAASGLKRAGLRLPGSYYQAVIIAHTNHRNGHQESLKGGTNYRLNSTELCDITNSQAAKDILRAEQALLKKQKKRQ